MNGDHHPTAIELDALFLGEVNPTTSAHVEACDICSGSLAQLREFEPVPAWLEAMQHEPIHVAPKRSPWALLMVAALIAAFVVPVLAAFSSFSTSASSSVRTKGMPAVTVHAKQGDHLGLWDGVHPFEAGDAIRFEVGAAGFSRVTVISLMPGAWRSLYAGAVDAREPVLPLSFVFDDQPEAETVAVVLSDAVLDEVTARDAVARERRDSQVWVTRLTLPKRVMTR